MHPILFKYGSLTLYTYGFFLALAFLGAIGIAGREAKRLGLPVETFFDLCFWAVVAALVGSRLMYVLLELRSFLAHPLQIFAIWGGGLDFQGGVILNLAVAIWFIRRHRLPWRPTLDALALGLPVGHFLGRIGCFIGLLFVLAPPALCPGRWSSPIPPPCARFLGTGAPGSTLRVLSGPGSGLRGAQLLEDQEELRSPARPCVFLPRRGGAVRGGVLPHPPRLSRPHVLWLDAP